MLDSSLVFYSLSIWINASIFLPTVSRDHSLDLMTFSKGYDSLSVSRSDVISDHFSIAADLKILTNYGRTVPQTITYRKLKAINSAAFTADIKTILNLLNILKPAPLNWFNIMTVFPKLRGTFFLA